MTARDDHNVIDLDSDTYFDLDGLRQFAAALLAQDGMDHPGPRAPPGPTTAPSTGYVTGWPP